MTGDGKLASHRDFSHSDNCPCSDLGKNFPASKISKLLSNSIGRDQCNQPAEMTLYFQGNCRHTILEC